MQAGGYLADRFGSRRVVILYAFLISLSVIPIGLVSDAWQLTAALFVFGIGTGGLDVSMNLQAAKLEEKYAKPIMSAFHALFSMGIFAGSLLGSLALSVNFDMRFTFLIAGLTGIFITVSCKPFLLRHVKKEQAGEEKDGRHARMPRKMHARVLLLGTAAFLLMLSEGVANDWSALQIKERLGASEAQAALGYASFAILMTAGRLGADKASAKWGPAAILRYGSLVAALGMLVVINSDWLWVTLVGWGLFGLGLSGSVPQIFTAAGRLSKSNQGVVMSRVVGMGYIGFLAGPAVIGWLTNFMPLNATLILPLAFMAITALGANRVMPPRTG